MFTHKIVVSFFRYPPGPLSVVFDPTPRVRDEVGAVPETPLRHDVTFFPSSQLFTRYVVGTLYIGEGDDLPDHFQV